MARRRFWSWVIAGGAAAHPSPVASPRSVRRGGRRRRVRALRRRRRTGFRIARAQVAQERLQRIDRGNRARDLGEFRALGLDRRGDDLEGARIGPVAHLAEIALAEPGETHRFLAERVADRGAHDVGALGVGERREFLPAIAMQRLELLRRLRPLLRRPEDVGAQPGRLAALDIGDDLVGDVVPAEVGKRPRFKQQALVAQIVVEVGDARRAQRRQRILGFAVHHVDHREPRGDLRARRALQAVVDLVLQQLAGLVEQIDRDQPVGEPPDHLVAAPADRGQLAEIVEQRERVDRRQRIALPGQEQAVEGRHRLFLDAAGHVRVRMRAQRRAHDVEGVAVAAFFGIETPEQLQRFDLGCVAAPDRGQGLERGDDGAAVQLSAPVLQQQSRAAGPAPPPDDPRSCWPRGRRAARPPPCRVLRPARPVSTETVGSSSRGMPTTSNSLRRLAAPVKSPTSSEARTMSCKHHALEFERQRRHRRLGVAEAVARFRPFAEPRIGERPPQRRVMLVADEGIRQILHRGVGAADHDVGDGAQHHRRRVLGRRRIVGDRDVEHRLRLGEHVAGEKEAREIAARRQALGFRRSRGGEHEVASCAR